MASATMVVVRRLGFGWGVDWEGLVFAMVENVEIRENRRPAHFWGLSLRMRAEGASTDNTWMMDGEPSIECQKMKVIVGGTSCLQVTVILCESQVCGGDRL